MSVALSPVFNGWQGFSINGLPLAGGLLNTYAAGTSTPLATFTDSSGLTPNSNPIQLGSDGWPPSEIWLTTGVAYKFVLTDSLGLNPKTFDNIIAGDPSAAGSLATALAASSGSSLVGFIQAGTGAVARTVQTELRTTFRPEQFGAVGDNVTDDLAAFNATVAAIPAAGGEIVLTPGKTYRLSGTLTYPTTNTKTVLQGRGATIRADHNGHCIDAISQNENYSRHVFENLVIQGPNVSYPMSAPQLAGTSTGAGIRLGNSADTSNTAAAFGCQFINVSIYGFLYGRYHRASLENVFVGGEVKFCQYGEYYDGGQSNANSYFGVRLRENRIAGLWSAGTTGGSLTNVTSNRFFGCLFETNIPYRGDNPIGYSGGYPTAMDNSGTLGIAVYLNNSYDWQFHGNYYENQNFSISLDGSSDQCLFVGDRYDGNGGAPRIGGVKILGFATTNHRWIGCHKNNASTTEVNITTTDATQTGIELLDCYGFNIITGSLAALPYVRNLRLSQAGGGSALAESGTPPQGIASDVQSGTSFGQINTIGSATATLLCQGFKTIVCNTAVAAAGSNTTIVALDPGGARDFVVKILNLQSTRVVTIKNNAVIKTKSGADVVLTSTVGTITLWIAPNGTAYEI